MPTGPAYRPSVVAAITVSDFKRALAWFNDVLGFPTEYVVEGMPWGEVRTNVPGLTIGISQSDGAGPGGAVLTFGVEDIAASRAQLEARGVAFDGPTDELPGMVKLANFHDADGNRYMLAEVLNQG